MKKLRLMFLASALTILIGALVPACGPFNCDGSDIAGYMDIKGFKPKNSNLILLLPLSANDSVSWSDYGINFNFEVDYVAQNQGFSLFNQAYACSLPEPGHLGSKEKITEMHIITLMDYDSTYLANDTIDGLFMIKNELREVDIQDFIDIQGKIYTPYTNYIMPTRQPASTRNAQFKIVMTLDNGEKYEGTTDVIRLKL